ncbi:uncharacterized protein LOC134191233 [Corticium candelabrum]|uniref:uncharacterized protein LOC134191233 n=1 Tax=Corticium candelabrum TaxID=121492 RepID=UPI002E275D29|nr:uncharacterized protein LOC134191233 [Corticium candelabrum]
MSTERKAPIAQVVEYATQPSSKPAEPLHHVYETIYTASHSSKAETFTVILKVNGRECKGLLDTGATRTLITHDIVTPTRPSPAMLKAYDGNAVETLGVADVTINTGDRSCQCTCFVVPPGQTVLFGQDVILQLQLLAKQEVNVVKIQPIDIMVDPQATPPSLPVRHHTVSLRMAIETELQHLKKAARRH